MSELKSTDQHLQEKEYDAAVAEVYKLGYSDLGFFLGKILNFSNEHLTSLKPLTEESYTRVSLHCNWLGPGRLGELWDKMSQGEKTWNKIRITENVDQADYHVVINSTAESIDFSRTIIFQMEPGMKDHPEQWGEWADPDPQKFLRVFTHDNSFNNCEWHLGWNYIQLKKEKIQKDPSKAGVISTVLSSKYRDPGHKKRVDFAKFLDTKDDVTLHVFGADLGYKNYVASPPYHNKNEAMMPYFYTFNVENQERPNYFTEKLIDSVLSESLAFYHGPRNIRDYFDERAFVWLELEDFEADYSLIKKVIAEDWRTLRLPYIRKEKERILEELQFFPRLQKAIGDIETPSSEEPESSHEKLPAGDVLKVTN